MMIADIDTTNLPTTYGGVAIFALAMVVWNYFAEKKKQPREVSKAANLDEQTALLREIAAQNRKTGKRAAKANKKSFKILKEVHGTVSEIRSDQKQSRKV